MTNKFVIPIVFFAAFGVGAYVWYLTQDENMQAYVEATADKLEQAARRKQQVEKPKVQTLVDVDGEPITSADVEWEYKVHVSGITDDPDLEHLSEFEVKFEGQLSPLKRRIIAGLVERKVLYRFLKRDTTFNTDDPQRYTECLTKWQEAVAANEEQQIPELQDEDRLKDRLCEQSVLLQYLDERVFSKLAVSNEEIESYYENHQDEFKEPERVLIRQILLASDLAARRVRNKLKKHNFVHYAKEKSIAPEAADGGLLGPFAKGEMPRVFDVAFDMRVYRISRIQKSTYGFHIIMPIKKYKARQMELSEVKDQVRDKLLEQKKEQAYEELLEQALATISVKTPKSLW